MTTALAFWAFAIVMLGSAGMVVTSRNPVHSVLFLILAFFNAAGLFLITGAEFLALTLVIVYVGAVAVLFLFVVMMLDVNFAELRHGFQRYAPIGAVVGVLMLGELAWVFTGWRIAPVAANLRFAPWPGHVENTRALGHLIYTDYVFLFQMAGLVLLTAMIGAIVLTHRERRGSKRQNIAEQVARQVTDTMVVVPVPLGAGMKDVGIFRKLPKPDRRKQIAHHGHGDHHADGHDHSTHGDASHGIGHAGPGEHG